MKKKISWRHFFLYENDKYHYLPAKVIQSSSTLKVQEDMYQDQQCEDVTVKRCNYQENLRININMLVLFFQKMFYVDVGKCQRRI